MRTREIFLNRPGPLLAEVAREIGSALGVPFERAADLEEEVYVATDADVTFRLSTNTFLNDLGIDFESYSHVIDVTATSKALLDQRASESFETLRSLGTMRLLLTEEVEEKILEFRPDATSSRGAAP